MAVIDFGKLNEEVAFMKKALRHYGLDVGFGNAIAALAKGIRDHAHLERMLTECDPSERNDFYESVRPHLSFIPWPLDVYVASAGQMAEREQLPILGSDGMLHPFRPAADVSSIEKLAEQAIAAEIGARTLTFLCAKCRKVEKFMRLPTETHIDAVLKARRTGWVHDPTGKEPKEICPACPTPLRKTDA